MKTVGPTVLNFDLLVFLLSMMIVGGRGSTWGPVVGSAALMLADYQFQAMGGWRTGALALITILFVVLYPRGLTGAVASLFDALGAIRRPPAPALLEAGQSGQASAERG